MTLSRVRPQRGLRSEVDQLSSEITLVLRRILVERRGQSRIVPCRRLGVVIDEIDSRGRGETHFPSARERTELCDGLRLDREVSRSTGGADHSEQLLTTRVDPRGGTGIVIDEIRSSFRRESLFPSCWKGSGTSRRRHRSTSGQESIVRWRTTSCRRRRTVRSTSTGIKHIVRQTSLVVSRTGITGARRLLCRVRTLIVTRSVPRRGPCVVVDIVLTPEVIDSTFPSGGERAQLVRVRVKVGVSGGGGCTVCAGAGRDARCSSLSGRVGRRSARGGGVRCIDGGLRRHCRSGCDDRRGRRRRLNVDRVRNGSHCGRGSRRGRHLTGRWARVRNRRRRVGAHIHNQLSVNGRVVRSGFLEFLCEHLVSAEFEVEDVGYLDVDDAEEALVLSLEFTLVKDLHGDDRGILDLAEGRERERLASDSQRHLLFQRTLPSIRINPSSRCCSPSHVDFPIQLCDSMMKGSLGLLLIAL